MTLKNYKYCNSLLDTFISDIPSILLYFQRSEPNSVQWVSLGFLHRLMVCSIGIKSLLKIYKKNNQIEFSIGLLIRPIILDALSSLIYYAILKKKGPTITRDSITKDIYEHAYTLLSDGLIYNLDYGKALFEKNIISIEELHAYYNDFASNYPEFLKQQNGNNTRPSLITKSPTGAKSTFKLLADDSDLKGLSHKLFNMYTFYSKYDHFGIMHFEIMKLESHLKEQNIIASIEFFIRHYYILADVFYRATPDDEVTYNFYLNAKASFDKHYSKQKS
jgi:hypothetical protein